MVCFGQVVIGPPGAGKSTYCQGMEMFCQEIGRPVMIINLDFANDSLVYPCAVDVRNFLKLEEVMHQKKLGPNGALVFCMEELYRNVQWLVDTLRSHKDFQAQTYLIMDCPGQVELYSHHDVAQRLLHALSAALDLRLCAVQLMDAYYCCQPSTFISATLLCTSMLLRLALPSVQVLSKLDLLRHFGPLAFPLHFFLQGGGESGELRRLVGYIGKRVGGEGNNTELTEEAEEDLGEEKGEKDEDQPPLTPLQRKFLGLNTALCDVLEDYNLVSFVPCSIEDAALVARVLAHADRANGYYMAEYYTPASTVDSSALTPSQATARAAFQYACDTLAFDSTFNLAMDVEEKYAKRA